MLDNILQNFAVMNRKKVRKSPGSSVCPQCLYPLDRPHAFHCSRCQAPIPLATGCNGCGRCRKK